MEKIDALLVLQSLTTPRTTLKVMAAMEQELSFVSGSSRRNRKQKQKKVMGETPGVMIVENANTPPTAKAPTANLNLEVKTPCEDILLVDTDFEDGEKLKEGELNSN